MRSLLGFASPKRRPRLVYVDPGWLDQFPSLDVSPTDRVQAAIDGRCPECGEKGQFTTEAGYCEHCRLGW